MEKNKAAKVLFDEGYSQTDIAKLLGVAINTVNRWATTGNWKERRISQSFLEDNSVQTILELIDYQTRALRAKVEKWKVESMPGEPTPLIERGDIDALQKLFTTIRKDSKKWSDYVSVMKEFFEFLQEQNIELAKEVSPFGDKFLLIKKDAMI